MLMRRGTVAVPVSARADIIEWPPEGEHTITAGGLLALNHGGPRFRAPPLGRSLSARNGPLASRPNVTH